MTLGLILLRSAFLLSRSQGPRIQFAPGVLIFLKRVLRSVAMQLVPYQTCRSTEGWFPVQIPSGSHGDRFYTVLVSPWAVNESICQCKGYNYRSRCKHQEQAAERVCGWSELKNRQQQNGDEREHKICPGCGGPTRWEVDVVDED